jgi:hypothetical protein
MAGRLLNSYEAAAYLSERWEQTSEAWMRRHQARIPHLKIGGKVRYDPADLDRYIESCRRPAEAAS